MNFIGSQEEARMKIYSVSTAFYYAFGAHVSRELSQKLSGACCSVVLSLCIFFFFVINFVFWIFTDIFIKTFQNARMYNGSFLIPIWTSRTKTMEVRYYFIFIWNFGKLNLILRGFTFRLTVCNDLAFLLS